MNTQTKELIQFRFKELPDEIKKVLERGDFQSTVKTIATKHTLSEQQATVLENEVALVLLAFEEHGSLATILQEELFLKVEAAKAIVADVDAEILKDVLPELQKIWDERPDEDSDEDGNEKGQEARVETTREASTQKMDTPTPNNTNKKQDPWDAAKKIVDANVVGAADTTKKKPLFVPTESKKVDAALTDRTDARSILGASTTSPAAPNTQQATKQVPHIPPPSYSKPFTGMPKYEEGDKNNETPKT